MADIQAIQGKTTEAVDKFKAHLNQRATKPPRTPEEAVRSLRNAHKPIFIVFYILVALAFCLDALDWLETAGDATIVLFFVQAALDIYFFIFVRALLNRGSGTSLFLLACGGGVLLLSVIPLIGPIASLMSALPIFALGLVNKNVRVLDSSRETLVADLETLSQKIELGQQAAERLARAAEGVSRVVGGIALSRQVAARLISVSRTSKRFGGAARKVVKSKLFKKFTKSSKVVTRLGIFTALDTIPFIEVFPFRVLGMVMTYFDQRRIYKEAQELLAEYEMQYAQLVGMDSAIVEAEMAIFTAQVQQWHVSRTAPQREEKPQEKTVQPASRPPVPAPAAPPSPAGPPPTPAPIRTPTPIRDIGPAASPLPAAA